MSSPAGSRSSSASPSPPGDARTPRGGEDTANRVEVGTSTHDGAPASSPPSLRWPEDWTLRQTRRISEAEMAGMQDAAMGGRAGGHDQEAVIRPSRLPGLLAARRASAAAAAAATPAPAPAPPPPARRRQTASAAQTPRASAATITTTNGGTSSSSSAAGSDSVTGDYVDAHPNENFHHRGKGKWVRGLPGSEITNPKTGVKGPGAQAWKDQASKHWKKRGGGSGCAGALA